ncbi:hypothetical protein [Amycolatopsis japonica]|uniref:hypothetical protein n=1 Tax=Amycolatopsis TaxID=1813 RepID=UPI000570A5CC|nr:hypothetical protein [Amycolatopsis japonica]
MDARLLRLEGDALTFGVEEEFVLADPVTGAVALAASRVLELLDGESAVMAEFLRFRIETATVVHTGLDELRTELPGCAAWRPARPPTLFSWRSSRPRSRCPERTGRRRSRGDLAGFRPGGRLFPLRWLVNDTGRGEHCC